MLKWELSDFLLFTLVEWRGSGLSGDKRFYLAIRKCLIWRMCAYRHWVTIGGRLVLVLFARLKYKSREQYSLCCVCALAGGGLYWYNTHFMAI